MALIPAIRQEAAPFPGAQNQPTFFPQWPTMPSTVTNCSAPLRSGPFPACQESTRRGVSGIWLSPMVNFPLPFIEGIETGHSFLE